MFLVSFWFIESSPFFLFRERERIQELQMVCCTVDPLSSLLLHVLGTIQLLLLLELIMALMFSLIVEGILMVKSELSFFIFLNNIFSRWLQPSGWLATVSLSLYSTGRNSKEISINWWVSLLAMIFSTLFWLSPCSVYLGWFEILKD